MIFENFVGLRMSGRARQRIQDFYDLNHVPTPDWMTKVDRLTT